MKAATAPPNLESEALPRPSDLPLGARLRYHGAVGSDYLLRTALATVVAGASVQAVVGGGRSERRRLEFLAELAAAHDAAAVFTPPAPVKVRTEPGYGPGIAGGRVELLRFRSRFVTVNPELRRDYARHQNNVIARAQHWRHDDGPRPTLCVIHGFGASPARFNTAFFALKEFFAEGWDVLLYTLPFHGSRRGGGRFAVNGIELFGFGLAHFSEAMFHAIHDFRALLGHLDAQGVPRYGVTGLSLGGYTSALLAATEPRLDFAVPNAAVTCIPPLMDEWFPANVTSRALLGIASVPDDLLERALSVHSALNYDPVLPRERLMIVAGLGDRLAPPSQSMMLWRHWDHPRLEWFPGSHVLHFGRGRYQSALRELIGPAGVT